MIVRLDHPGPRIRPFKTRASSNGPFEEVHGRDWPLLPFPCPALAAASGDAPSFHHSLLNPTRFSNRQPTLALPLTIPSYLHRSLQLLSSASVAAASIPFRFHLDTELLEFFIAVGALLPTRPKSGLSHRTSLFDERTLLPPQLVV